MPSIVKTLEDQGLITPPPFLSDNVQYETIMGSVAYGVSSDTSDNDIYGFCIPPKHVVFPHLAGEIEGFGRQKQRFEQYQKHHIDRPDNGKQYDVTIYSVVKFFSLCMENNPNMVDALFTPRFCVLHTTKVGEMVRERRHMFLHKGSWHKFKGYAYSQLHKMKTKDPNVGSKRREMREKFGFDVKFAYHVVRLLDEAEQILMHGDLDLQRNREQMKAIRRGEWKEEEIRKWASAKEEALERLYESSKLPHSPDEESIKQLLLDCLEHHYGSLDKAIVMPNAASDAIEQISAIVDRFNRLHGN